MRIVIFCGLFFSSLLISQAQNPLRITSSYFDPSLGLTHTYYQYEINGYAVMNSALSEHTDVSGKVVHHTESQDKIRSQAPAAVFSLTPATVLQKATAHWGVHYMAPPNDVVVGKTAAEFHIPAFSEERIRIEKGYYLAEDGSLQTAWMVEAFPSQLKEWKYVFISDAQGTVVNEGSYMAYCHNNHTSKQASHASQGLLDSPAVYRVYKFPASNPIDGPYELLSEPTNNTGSPSGWHRVGSATSTPYYYLRGNNVYAYPDTQANNQSFPYPNSGFGRIFDFNYNGPFVDSKSNLRAATTQLFYANNYLHDIFYMYGFTEAAGNFQANNFSKGGAQGDAVDANAQDGSGTSNANFQAPVDGIRGRMQMYLWPRAALPATVRIDSPASSATSVSAAFSSFGLQPPSTGVHGKLVWVNDNGANDGKYGCDPLINAAQLNGNIAVIKRNSNCSFTNMVYNAQQAGAIAVIVINTAATTVSQMTGSDSRIYIPSAMVPGSIESTINNKMLTGDVWVTMLGIRTPIYDSDFDNEVMAHEYTHGVSIRLTGGPSRSSCLNNGEQAGEGWSDFFALAFTARKSDNLDGARGMATWVNGDDSTGIGLRQYRYSRNMTVNPMTYNNIKYGIPPHSVGSVFCTMLWDLHQNMVEAYGFDENIYSGSGGNNIAIQLVFDGLKLQPCSPGFIDSRNAILKADSIRYGGAHAELIWKTFARRGLGASAVQGSVNDRNDGKDAFDTPVQFWANGINASIVPDNKLELVPNPAYETVRVTIPAASRGEISIVDLNGKTIYSTAVEAGRSLIQVPVSELANGMYLVRFTSAEGLRWEQKLVKAN